MDRNYFYVFVGLLCSLNAFVLTLIVPWHWVKLGAGGAAFGSLLFAFHLIINKKL